MTPSTHEALVRAREALLPFTRFPQDILEDNGFRLVNIQLETLQAAQQALALIDALLPDPKADGAGLETARRFVREARHELKGDESHSRWLYSDEELTARFADALSTLSRERDEANDKLHYANGVADFAIKGRTEAEATIAALTKATDGLVPMDVARAGFALWAGKAHNAKWLRKIDGTPIPNDIIVNMAEAFGAALASPAKASEPQWRADLLEGGGKGKRGGTDG